MENHKNVKGILLFSIVMLVGCAPELKKVSVPSATIEYTRIFSIIYSKTPAFPSSSPSYEITPTIFNSYDKDIYDNFNNTQYDGSINSDLWIRSDDQNKYIFQENGYLTIINQNNKDECIDGKMNENKIIASNNPFYVQADIKVDKDYSNGSIGMRITSEGSNNNSDKAFSAICVFSPKTGGNLNSYCHNYWWFTDDTSSEKYQSNNIISQMGQWRTFRIDYDPQAAIFTYFIDNEAIGIYQVIDTKSIYGTYFTLYLDVCREKNSTIKGYYDNIRIGYQN